MLERYKWLNTATAKIRFGPDRKAVQRELEAHLDDAKERRTAAGLPEEEAEAAVLEAMGDPEAIAEELGRLHRPWLGYLWRASQIVLAGTVLVYVLLLGVRVVRDGRWLRPGARLYHYLTWESDAPEDAERELSCRERVETGGYKIQVERAALRESSMDDWGMYLDLSLDITLSRWEESLFVWNAVPSVRSDSGEALHHGAFANEAVWGFWQKAELLVFCLPEDAKWVELDFGYGELRRTMRIDLTEEAAA